MRVWFPHLVVAALVLVVAVLLLTSMETEARRYIMVDGFEGANFSKPDANKRGSLRKRNLELIQRPNKRRWSRLVEHWASGCVTNHDARVAIAELRT